VGQFVGPVPVPDFPGIVAAHAHVADDAEVRGHAAAVIERADGARDRGRAAALVREAIKAPAITRLRQVVAFVGARRRVTTAGNLTPADARALADALGGRCSTDAEVRSMDHLPDVAHVYHWAVAARILTVRRTIVRPGPVAGDLERNPVVAWMRAATTRLDHGLLDGFQRGYRKHYVELLDASAPAMLAGMVAAGGELPIASIQNSAWDLVGSTCGYDREDLRERSFVDRLVVGMVAALVDLGAAERRDATVALTGLGGALATAVIA
jgi:hypothetical protein